MSSRRCARIALPVAAQFANGGGCRFWQRWRARAVVKRGRDRGRGTWPTRLRTATRAIVGCANLGLFLLPCRLGFGGALRLVLLRLASVSGRGRRCLRIMCANAFRLPCLLFKRVLLCGPTRLRVATRAIVGCANLSLFLLPCRLGFGGTLRLVLLRRSSVDGHGAILQRR